MFHCYLLFYRLSYIIHSYFHYPAVVHVRFAFCCHRSRNTHIHPVLVGNNLIMILYKFSITHQVDDVRATGLCPQ